jgi:folate-binding protein YgfZ
VDLEAYRAVRHGAGVIDRSSEGRILVWGADRAGWLQGLLTNDVAALAPGSGCYAAWLTPQGRMLADARVLALHDRMLIDVPGARTADLARRLDQLIIMEDVRVENATARVGRLAVHGPRAASVVATALGAPHDAAALAQLSEHQNRVAQPSRGIDVVVAGARDAGVAGFDLYFPAVEAHSLLDRIGSGGAAVVDAATWDVLRLEAARPIFGIDMDEDTIPLEAGIESRAISFTKGCYVGQEVIVRVRDRGHGRVARRLVGLLEGEGPTSSGPLARGSRLYLQGREVGKVTSAAWSPTLKRQIALGYVARDAAAPGTRVDAEGAAGPIALEIVSTPFLPDSV